MDQLTAYRVLGLSSDASIEEVKEAYARLSKEYHPEENPEEFQRIHEAYTTLTRRGRRASHTTITEPKAVKQTTSVVKKETDLVFHVIENTEEEVVDDDAGYDFDESIHQAKDDENKKLLQSVIQADKELKILFVSSNYKNPDKFKAFFARKEFTETFYTREFISSLTQCLSKEKLKPELYSFLIEFYHLRKMEFEDLVPEAQRLYQVIDNRYSIKKDTYKVQRPVNKYAMFAIIWFVVIRNWGRLTNVFDGNDFLVEDIVCNVLPYVLIACVGIWLYKLFRRQHSTYFAQAIVAGIFSAFAVVLIFVFSYMVRYTDVLPSKLPLSLSAVYFWVSIDWLIIVGITAFLQKIRKRK